MPGMRRIYGMRLLPARLEDHVRVSLGNQLVLVGKPKPDDSACLIPGQSMLD